MNTDETTQPPFFRLPLWIRGALLVWSILGAIPLLLKAFGFHFLPSQDWVALIRIPAVFSGAVFAVLFVVMVIYGLRLNSPAMGHAKKFLVVSFTPLMGFFIGSSAFTLGGPMVGAIIAGTQVGLPFTVVEFERSVDRKCQNPITLSGLPFMFDDLCGFPEKFGSTLDIGGKVLVVGKGTRIGIFPTSARKID